MATKNTGQYQKQKQQQQQQQPHQTLNSKALIDKDNLKDEDFDKLVIDISNIVSSSQDVEAEKDEHSEAAATVASDSIEPTGCLFYNSNSGSNSNANGSHNELVSSSNCSNIAIIQNDPYNRLNQPKRPMNAFMVWGRAIRREIHLRFSNVQNALLSKALGRVWRTLDSSIKEPYVRKANLIKANHRRDYPDYRYQPRRLQERERNKRNKLDETPMTAIMTTTLAGANYQTSSQYFSPQDTRIADQTSSTTSIGAIYPTINGEQLTAHRRHHTTIRMDSSSSSSSIGSSNRRLTNEHELAQTLSVPNQCYASNFACQQDNNHVPSNSFKNSIFGACNGTKDDVQTLKSQYYDEYHASQLHRSMPSSKQQYSYSGPYQHQHQFAYNMQLQQQQHQTYQQSHLHMLPHQQQQQNLSETTRISYVENCSLSAASSSLDSLNRHLTIPSTVETNSSSFRAYESRN